MRKGGRAKKAEDGKQGSPDRTSRSESDRCQYAVASHVSAKTTHKKEARCISVAANDDKKQSRSQFPHRCTDWICGDQTLLEGKFCRQLYTPRTASTKKRVADANVSCCVD